MSEIRRKPAKTRNARLAPKFQQELEARDGKVRARKAQGGKRSDSDGGHERGQRIAKVIARAGLCSRREAERWIADGRVSVNGSILTTPAFEVQAQDRVLVDGAPLPEAREVRLWRYYKARGMVTTHRDPEGRPTVFDALPARLGRVISVGRLDFNSEGLLLLTTSGALARHLELPTTALLRRYRVRARGKVTQSELDAIKNGIEIDGVRYGPIEATLDSVGGSNVWLTVGLREGKNREVRRVLAHLGLTVSRLIRISYGPFRLGELRPGEIEPVRRKVLSSQLAPRVAAELGLVDRSGESDGAPAVSVRRMSRQGGKGKPGRGEEASGDTRKRGMGAHAKASAAPRRGKGRE